MMQVIDEDYIRETFALERGPERLLALLTGSMERADTAEAIAKACVAQVTPLKRRVDELLAANSRLVFEKRDIRVELEAQLDAAHAELDEYRGKPIGVTITQIKHEHIDIAQLLEWFDMRHDLDLSYQYDLEPRQIPKSIMKPGPIPEEGWTVHKRHGGRNDQEWDMVALEATPLEALRAAHKVFCDGN